VTVECGAQVEPEDHLVQFYACEDELASIVSQFLAEGVLLADVAIVVATEAHSDAFKAGMAAVGVDIERSRRDGSVIMIDAVDLLSCFMAGGAPDPAAFDRVVGGLVREASGTGRRVRVYGEMVALLWDAGFVAAAIELEMLWNELRRRVPFSLLCGYRTRSLTGDGRADAFNDVCHLHSGVAGLDATVRGSTEELLDLDAEAGIGFACTDGAPRAARRYVGGVLQGWGREDLLHEASFIVTELATNAIVHADSEFIVVVSRRPGAIRISVRDGCHTAPALRPPETGALSGRGMALVAALSTQWGSDPIGDGKVVWADLSTAPPKTE
jgi:hypothetical protein